MNTESGKTMMYVAAAVIMAVVGIALAPAGPKAAQDGIDGLIGAEFYKNFKNPDEATARKDTSPGLQALRFACGPAPSPLPRGRGLG